MCGRVLLPFALWLIALPALGQIVSIELASPRLAKQYKKWLIERNGKLVICGEPLEGLEARPRLKKLQTPKYIVLAVADPARPEREITRPDGSGGLKLLARGRRCKIAYQDWKNDGRMNTGIKITFQHQTLGGLRREYLRKKANLDTMQAEQKKMKLGSPEWFASHRKILVKTDSLVAWLDGTLYPKAARKLEKKYAIRLKKAAKGASKFRLEEAKKALGPYKPRENMVEVASSGGGSARKWHGRSGKHMVVVAHTGITASTLQNLVILGERVIESFRTHYIDPDLGPEDVDPVPEDLFIKMVFFPDDRKLYNHVLHNYYGSREPKGKDREAKLAVPGHRLRGGSAGDVDHINYWRIRQGGSDLEGMVTSFAGRVMAWVAYNNNRHSAPSWISEGWGYWTSFEFLGRNNVTSVSWSSDKYHRKADKKGVKPNEIGMRTAFNSLALDKGPALSDLMTMKLVEMAAPELAKSWSFLDFIVTRHVDKADAFMRACCQAKQGKERTDLETLRPAIHEIFKLEKGADDVYKALDDLWRDYAARDQLKSKKRGR